MKQRFRVGGMSCAACSAHVEKRVAAVPGVREVQVNLLAGSMVVQYDEGACDAENRGRKMGITAFCLMEVAIAAFNVLTEQPNHVPLALFWTFCAAEAYPKYRFTGKKSFLVTSVLGGLCAVLFFATYVISVLK